MDILVRAVARPVYRANRRIQSGPAAIAALHYEALERIAYQFLIIGHQPTQCVGQLAGVTRLLVANQCLSISNGILLMIFRKLRNEPLRQRVDALLMLLR